MNIKKALVFAGCFLVVTFFNNPVDASSQSPSPVYQLRVDGLACPFCAYGIEKNLMKIEAVEKIEIDIQSGIITLWVKEGQSIKEEEIRNAVNNSGFTLRQFTKLPTSDPKRE